MDGLPDGSTDESDDVWMERNFPGLLHFRKFHTGILIGIFTVNLAVLESSSLTYVFTNLEGEVV